VATDAPAISAASSWPLRVVSRAVDLSWRAIVRGLVEFYNSSNLTFASSIAYYSLLSFFPFVLLILSVCGQLVVGVNEETLVRFVARALPSHFDFVVAQIEELARAPKAFGVVHTIILVWASMGVFGAVTSAVNHAWGVAEPPGFFKHKLIAFVMLMLAGVLTMVVLTLGSLLQIVEAHWFAGVVWAVPWLTDVRGFMYRRAPTPIFILIVGLIYYFVPNARVRLRDVWLGAALAGGLWRLAFAAFAWYVRDFSRFSSVHGSIAAVIVFLIWVYVSAVILLYGAEVSAAHARLRKNLPQKAPAAAPLDVAPHGAASSS
jgi:membrane protein